MGRQDLARELASVPFLIDTAVADTRSPNLHGTQASLDLSRRAMAIPDHQALPFLVPEVGIPAEVVFDLCRQGLRQQPLRSIKEDLAW